MQLDRSCPEPAPPYVGIACPQRVNFWPSCLNLDATEMAQKRTLTAAPTAKRRACAAVNRRNIDAELWGAGFMDCGVYLPRGLFTAGIRRALLTRFQLCLGAQHQQERAEEMGQDHQDHAQEHHERWQRRELKHAA